MVDRFRARHDNTPIRPRNREEPTLQELEGSLEIDQDDLDSCLTRQPGLFNLVANQVITANSRRDTLKMQLEEVRAQLDQDIRQKAQEDSEGDNAPKMKLTETAIQNQLRTMPRLKEAQRELMTASTQAERWQALKEAYLQRSYMLKELVAIQLAQFYNLGVEKGIVAARRDLGTQAREREIEGRRNRRMEREAG